MSSENKDLAEFFRKSVIPTPRIIMTERDFNEVLEAVKNPPAPNPALILAMDKGRRLRESMKK